jgi:hypothetical protein
VALHRRAAKRDDNEQAIVDRLRQLGAEVYRVSATGFPDLVLTWRGLLRVAEVKKPKAKLNEAQRAFHLAWNGPPIPILTDPEDATVWLLSLSAAAQREARVFNRHHETMKALEDA